MSGASMNPEGKELRIDAAALIITMTENPTRVPCFTSNASSFEGFGLGLAFGSGPGIRVRFGFRP